MADLLPPLIGVLKADVTGWVKSMAEVKGSTEAATSGAGKAFNGLATVGKVAFLGVGIAVAGVGATSLKMAGDFESATTRLMTSAGETRDHIDMVRKGILDMAGQVGISAQELAQGMYVVDSANIHGADSLKVLRAAAEGAKTENADLAVVANAVTSAMADYHLGADQAATVTTKLVSAVSMGKTTFQELTGSMHSVLPEASAAHISMSDILGDLASMTEHGISAQQATDNLAHTIGHLQTTTAPQNKELALLGINAQNLSAELGTKGLSGTLIEISKAIQEHMGANGQVILQMQQALHGLPPEVQKLGAAVIDGSMSLGDFTKAAKGLNVEQAGLAHQFATLMTSTHGIGSAQKTGAEIAQSYAASLKAATGDSTTLGVALMLTGENADYTTQAVKTVSGATTEAGNHVAGWSEIQKTFNQHLAKAEDGLGAMAITLGTQLIPYANNAIDTTQRLADWFSKHHTATVALAAAIGGPLVAAMAAYVIQLGMAAAGTVIATARTIAHTVAMVANAAVTGGQALAAFIALAAEYGIFNALSVTTIGMWAAKTAATIANTAVTVASGVAMGVVRGATLLWMGAQWLLNAALFANPIGLVILAIAALAAGVIWAYQNVGWFHSAVDTAWSKLKQFGGWVRDTLGPIISGIGDAIGAVGGALKGLADAVSSAMGAANSANASASSAGAKNPAARASGGPVIPGSTYTVGEEGPETLVMGSSGGYVIPSARGGGGGGSGSGAQSQAPTQQTDMGGTNALLEDHNALLQEQNMLLSQILEAVRPRSAFSTKAYNPAT